MSKLSSINIHIQRHLFPALEEEIGVPSSKEKLFVKILELIEVNPFLVGQGWCQGHSVLGSKLLFQGVMQ